MNQTEHHETCVNKFNNFVRQSRNYISDSTKMNSKEKLLNSSTLIDQSNWILENCQDTRNFFDETLNWRGKVRSIYEG